MATDESNPLAAMSERLEQMAERRRAALGFIGQHDWVELGTPIGRYRVNWQYRSGDTYETDVTARDFAEAAWMVAELAFDTCYPSSRQLLGVTRLK